MTKDSADNTVSGMLSRLLLMIFEDSESKLKEGTVEVE